jgi:dienelactone hydrolase
MEMGEVIAYTADNLALEGRLIRPHERGGASPGILVFHEFMGLGAYLERHLQNLADLGYVVMAADMYGRGVRPASAHDALGYSRPLRADRSAMRRRAEAALACLRSLPFVEGEKIAAIGYSFGGCAALELARSGADLKAAVSVYGYLDAPLPAAPGTIKARLLIFHGMHDPVVSESELVAFRREMTAVGADNRLVVYPDAGHGFCNRQMDGRQHPWNRYSRWHDEDVWKTLAAFLAETFIL